MVNRVAVRRKLGVVIDLLLWMLEGGLMDNPGWITAMLGCLTRDVGWMQVVSPYEMLGHRLRLNLLVELVTRVFVATGRL